MSDIIQESVGEWFFQATSIKGIKTKIYGEPFNAIVSISLINGDAFVHSLLSTVKLTKYDHMAIEGYLKGKGYNFYYRVRYRAGIPYNQKKTIK